MKKVEAVIRAHKVDDVKVALRDLGVAGLTAWEVQGLGLEEGRAGSVMDLVPMVKMEIVAEDAIADSVERVLVDLAGAGISAGIVFVADCGSVTMLGPGRGAAAAS